MRIQDLERSGPGHWLYDVKDQLKTHVYGRSLEAFKTGDAARDDIQTKEQLDDRRMMLRGAFIKAFGGLPPMDTPLDPQITGVIEEDGFRIEKVIFRSRPGSFVTANLYIPEGITESRGAVQFLCGHHMQAKHQGEYQIVCRYLVKAGLVVLAQDPVGQGERFSYYEKSLGTTVDWGVPEHDHAGVQCLLLGDGIARYFVHDAMRGIDYLCSRHEVDPAKIGVTGNSGGGTQTSLMMACDPRIAAAAPGTFIMNRETYLHTGEAQDAEQIWRGMSALGFDHEDVIMMMAPKPVRVLAVTSDFFPIEGTRRTVQRCRRVWEIYGKGENIDLVEDNCTHAYTRLLAKSAAEFFSKHLLGKQVSPRDDEIRDIDPQRLWCTASGQVRADIEGARFVFEENQDRLVGCESARKALPQKERTAWLEDQVFSNRKPCDLNPRFYQNGNLQDLLFESAIWFSQEDILNNAHVIRDFRLAGKDIPVTLAVWQGGTGCIRPHINWIRNTCQNGRAVMLLDVTGTGALTPAPLVTGIDPMDPYGALFKLTDDLFWLNDSLAAMRVYDVIRALDMIELWPGLDSKDIIAYGHGRPGLYLQLATSLDGRIQNVETVDGIGSYADWVRSRHYDEYDVMGLVLPGVLRYFDLPESTRKANT